MQHVYLTVDLGFGDAGKGSLVDFLARREDAHTVVRYNGGAQAGHRVVTAEAHPREHVFAQFGSGTLAGAATHLSRFMLLEPLAMVEEQRHLEALGVDDAFRRTTIDRNALVITPFGRAANRLKELARGAERHGSCGMGIGETVFDSLQHGRRALFAGDLANPRALADKLQFLRAVNLAKVRQIQSALPDTEQAARELELLLDDDLRWLVDAYRDFAGRARIVDGAYLGTVLARPGAVIFEGAQGVLLDEWNGFHPYTTWSTTTLANANALLREASYTGRQTRVGLTRAYLTRHGAGPLVTEDPALSQALPDPRNRYGAWQGGFRVGWPDMVMLRYALDVVGPLDWLAVTCLDRLDDLPAIRACVRYRRDNATIERIEPSPAPRSLAYQEQLTHTLARCQPQLETLPDQAALLDLLAASAGTPIGLVSNGPTAADKLFVRVPPRTRVIAARPAARGMYKSSRDAGRM